MAADPTDADHFARATALRRELLGDAMTDQIATSTDAFDQPFRDFTIRNVFGGSWLDGLVSKRELALVNVGMLAGAGRFEEAGVYFGVALRLGVQPRELRALLMHITVYCGTPVGRQLFRAAKRVLAEQGVSVTELDDPPGQARASSQTRSSENRG